MVQFLHKLCYLYFDKTQILLKNMGKTLLFRHADPCSQIVVISESVNPFAPYVQNKFIFNITTRKSASAETTSSPVNIFSKQRVLVLKTISLLNVQ